MTLTIQQTEAYRAKLETCLNLLKDKIGVIQIGSSQQFPFGWRKAAKGRTVWRIVEEAINQNLERFHEELGISEIEPSDSEVSVYDTKIKFQGDTGFIYTNQQFLVEEQTKMIFQRLKAYESSLRKI